MGGWGMTRALAGRAARSAGERLESDLVRGFRPPGVYLRRTSPAYAMHHIDGRLTPVVIDRERGCPDFHGAVRGVPVAFEAKSTTDARWKLRQLAENQAQALGDAMQAGVVVGVLLRYDMTNGVWWLPWRSLRDWWIPAVNGNAARGLASVTEDQCESIGRRVVGLRWWEAVGAMS